MKKIVVIAAAGKGKRLGAGVPKCLVEVNGRALFEYALEAFKWADEIRMVVGYKKEEVMARVSKVNPSVKFIVNDEYEQTNTLQSNYMGVKGVEDKVLFIDGDMIISKETSERLLEMYNIGEEFVGVATDISQEPVYAMVDENRVIWFDFNKKAEHEWANVALLSTEKLEYLPTYFFVQIEKFLPLAAVEVDRLEVDTLTDLQYAENCVTENPKKYNYWN